MKETLQEQLIAARRGLILDAAAKVFAEKGFHPTTIKDIAREAGIADGTIYNYFENKPALLLGIFEQMKAAVLQAADFSALLNGDVRAILRAYLRHPLTALSGENLALLRAVLPEILVNQELRSLYYAQILEPTLAMAEALLEQWVAERRIKPRNISLTARAISGMVLGLLVEHLLDDAALAAQWEAIPEFVSDLLLDGLEGDSA